MQMCVQCDPGVYLSEDNHRRDEFTCWIAMLIDFVILENSLKTLAARKQFFKCKILFQI